MSDTPRTESELSRSKQMDIKPELTRREAVFFELFKQGLSDKQIGILAGVGAGTVSHHMNNIRKKYKVRTRRELMIASRKEWVGLGTDDEIIELSKDAWGRDKLAEGRSSHKGFYVGFARLIERKLKERNA